MIIVGANVSSAGGILAALPSATALGVQALQFFASSPRSFARRIITDDDAADLRIRFRAAGFHSLWIHGSYLANFATANNDALKRSMASLIADLTDCARLGGRGVIFHLGSHQGRGVDGIVDQVVASLKYVIDASPSESLVVIENSAGMGGSVGSKFEELGRITEPLVDYAASRVFVCLDTQHTFAAGYPVHTKDGLDQTLEDFDRQIGLDRLAVLHMNDSKIPLGGGVDRHENLGEGQIGYEGMRVITQHPKLQNLPFLLEVPGQNHSGPDKDNVDRLKGLIQQ